MDRLSFCVSGTRKKEGKDRRVPPAIEKIRAQKKGGGGGGGGGSA